MPMGWLALAVAILGVAPALDHEDDARAKSSFALVAAHRGRHSRHQFT